MSQFCRIILRNSVAYLGIKLYNKLPNKLKKLEEIQEFKRKPKFVLLQHILTVRMNILLNIIISYLSLCILLLS